MNNDYKSLLTPRARNVLLSAEKEARRTNCTQIFSEHIILGLLLLGEGVAIAILKRLKVPFSKLRQDLEISCQADNTPEYQEESLEYSKEVDRILKAAKLAAENLKYNYIGTEHLLLGVTYDFENHAAAILLKYQIDSEVLLRELSSPLDPKAMPRASRLPQPEPENELGYKPDKRSSEDERAERFADPNTGGQFNALNAFGRDLNTLAKNGALDNVIGRRHEIERVIQILCRRTKNNPVLIGEAGVGKTAIVEGLAQMIVNEDVPDLLRNKHIFSIDLALMLAGTKYRGQFEERIKSVMNEAKSEYVILFIDEIHTIVGAGGAEGSMDAANIIKPALSRGELQCIGATTLDEYRKGIEKDSALERRFQPVMIEPPTAEDAIEILRGIRGRYEAFHQVQYSDEALNVAVRLSERYITGRFLPDKAIDLMDEAGALVRIREAIPQPDVTAIDEKIRALHDDKDRAVATQQFELAGSIRDNIITLLREREERMINWKEACAKRLSPVTEDDISEVLANLTGIPVRQLRETEMKRLLHMEENLKKTILCQSEAVHTVCRALRRARADLKDPCRPIGSFIFLGSTGVGKTLLAKSLAQFMFGDADALIHVDMSEYMEKFNVSRLIGSPPGYVGHGEGGELTERVRRRPYSVVLFDEIEKAHPDVMHILLQILEEGRLTDTLGRRVDFRNTVVIMTSNIGAEQSERGELSGFGQSATNAELDYERLGRSLSEAAKKRFKPEFINRIDEIVVFRKLSREDLQRIIRLEADKVISRLKSQGIVLKLEDDAVAYLLDKGVQLEYGARPLRRALERYLEDPLAEEILRGTFRNANTVLVRANAEGIYFVPQETASADEHVVSALDAL